MLGDNQERDAWRSHQGFMHLLAFVEDYAAVKSRAIADRELTNKSATKNPRVSGQKSSIPPVDEGFAL
jgi:hypothetical protein